MTDMNLNKIKFPVTVLLLQVVFVILFAVFVEYDVTASPGKLSANHSDHSEGHGAGPNLDKFYPSKRLFTAT